MKKGLVILSLAGIALLAFLYFSPVTPPAQATEEDVASESQPHEHDHSHDATDADGPDAQVDRLLEQMRTGELPPMQAVLKIRDIAEAHPENVKANMTLGQMSMQTSQYEKAVGRFKVVTEQQPENPMGHRLLAEAYLRSGNRDAAASSFATALELADEATAEKWKAELPELN